MTTEQKKQGSYYRGFRLGCVCGIALGIASVLYGPTVWERFRSSLGSDKDPPAEERSAPRDAAEAEHEAASPAEPVEAQAGRKLYATAENSRVYEDSSTESTVLGWVDRGQDVVEIARREGWVNVGVARTGITGWMPDGSVSTRRPGGEAERPMTPAFQRFRVGFDAFSERVQAATGTQHFTAAEDMGGGVVQVTATDTWWTGTLQERVANVKTIYELWKAANQTTLPLSVNVVDRSGRMRISYPEPR